MRSDHTMKAGQALAMDGDIWDWLKVSGVAGMVGGSLAGAYAATLKFITWAFPFRASRDDAKQARLDKGFAAYTAKMEERCNQLEARCDKSDKLVDDMRAALLECEQKHLVSDRKIMEMDAMMQAAGMARQMAQQTIAADKQKGRVT